MPLSRRGLGEPGNPTGSGNDYLAMTGAVSCPIVRESLSALMDQEWPALPREDVMAHLRACQDCRTWQDRAYTVTRRARAGSPAPPDGLALAVTHRLAGRRRTGEPALQVALGVVAAGVGLLALPALVLGRAEASEHVAHELGALNLALAGAFLLAAFRPGRAAGLLPMFGILVVLLAVTAGDDLARGFTTWRHERPHAVVLAGFVLLVCLARMEARRTAPPAPGLRATPSVVAHRRAGGSAGYQERAG